MPSNTIAKVLNATQRKALQNLLDSWRTSDPYFDLGPRLNCPEADALADFLRAFGETQAAEDLLNGHAVEDERGDSRAHLKRKKEYLASLEEA